MFPVMDQLSDLARTLSLVSDQIGPVEPGQTVNVEIVSTAQQLLAADPLSLAGITGTLPAPATQLLSMNSVRLKVEWNLFKYERRAWRALKLGIDYLMPVVARGIDAGMSGAQASFLFKPPIVELLVREEPLPPLKIKIKPTITLEVLPLGGAVPVLPPGGALPKISYTIPNGDIAPGNSDYLALKLEIVALEIPAVLILFRHAKFQPFENNLLPGFALTIVRGGASVRDVTELLNKTLARIEEAVRPLKTLAGFAAFLLKLPLLRSALGASPMVRTLAGDVDHLFDIHMRVDKFWGIDVVEEDLRADDRVSSLMFLGPPGSAVECFNDTKFKTGQGALRIEAGLTLVVLADDLKTVRPGALPEGIEITVDDPDHDFNDSMSSVRFV